jgi:hypothetical protein
LRAETACSSVSSNAVTQSCVLKAFLVTPEAVLGSVENSTAGSSQCGYPEQCQISNSAGCTNQDHHLGFADAGARCIDFHDSLGLDLPAPYLDEPLLSVPLPTQRKKATEVGPRCCGGTPGPPLGPPAGGVQSRRLATSALCECGSGAPRRRALRGPCCRSNPPGKKKKRGAQKAGGCHQRAVRVRVRCGAGAGSARTLLTGYVVTKKRRKSRSNNLSINAVLG